ncbi:MAG: AAA family ATPase [Clostridiaceae bacterium]|nr:AAA family ATPase [Clostridiaceae bacterium]
MKFNEALMCVELIIESDAVPLLIGESGIGKTALIKKLGEKNDFYIINIDGNMLKEGEIGGLPTVEDYFLNIDGEEVRLKRTVYAVHTKLQEIQKVLSKTPEKTILLFIDEINRCEHSVQQELMNIILNREINGFKILKQVKVVAAMNPSSKYDAFSHTDYQVIDMDPAQEDRFVWIELESDARAWIAWGMDSEGFNIHQDILNFISSFPDCLHTPFSKEMVKATPRSWERVSNFYKVYLKRKNEISNSVFYNVIKGNVGASIAQEFINFLENNKNPIMTPSEIFTGVQLQQEIIDKIKGENHSRLYLVAKNVFQYLKNLEDRSEEVNMFAKLLQFYPPDLKLAIMREIKELYADTLYTDFLMNEVFIEGYFTTYYQVEG